jgi:hypothetical protein
MSTFDAGDSSEKTYFTLAEANALIPWLSATFSRVFALRIQLADHIGVFRRLGQDVSEASLRRTDGPDKVQAARARILGIRELLRDDLMAITQHGIEVKDPDTGLCDFWSCTTLPGRDVYLCWRFGESEVAFYHEPHAGFAGRTPLRFTQ